MSRLYAPRNTYGMGRLIVDAIWACRFRYTQVFGREKNIFAGKRLRSLDAQTSQFE
jgi:hypothetical protein